jgi:hypothetical protein
VSEAKEDLAFLPNIPVGLQIYDSCIPGTQALRTTLALLSNQQYSSMMYLIECKNVCKCYNVPIPGTIKKKYFTT